MMIEKISVINQKRIGFIKSTEIFEHIKKIHSGSIYSVMIQIRRMNCNLHIPIIYLKLPLMQKLGEKLFFAASA
jgi:hypothetical protein